jgi:hypothetical protein
MDLGYYTLNSSHFFQELILLQIQSIHQHQSYQQTLLISHYLLSINIWAYRIHQFFFNDNKKVILIPTLTHCLLLLSFFFSLIFSLLSQLQQLLSIFFTLYFQHTHIEFKFYLLSSTVKCPNNNPSNNIMTLTATATVEHTRVD